MFNLYTSVLNRRESHSLSGLYPGLVSIQELIMECISFLLPICLCLMGVANAARFPSRKIWWAKQITNDLHVGGWLTENQIKYAKESEYKSIISLFNISTRSYLGPGEADPLPTTDEAATLSRDIGLVFETVLPSVPSLADWATESTIAKFSQVFESVPKPALMYDQTGYASAFIGLMYYLQKSKSDATAEPKLNASLFFKHASILGYPYILNETLKDLVLKVDGSENVSLDDEENMLPSNPDWYTLPAGWQMKPFSERIYLSGQIQTNHIETLKMMFDVMVNLRKGVTSGGQPTQEESILLNIKDRTGTYSNGVPIRQTTENLEQSRINSSLPKSYISPTSQVNYQTINTIQFGDDVGYNETIEREFMKSNNIVYHHAPIGGVYKYGPSLWPEYRDLLMGLARSNATILLQCRTGYRSAVMGMLMYGCLHGYNSTQVLERAYLVGYQFQADLEVAVVQMMKDVLDNREEQCESEKSSTVTTTITKTTEMSGAPITMYGPHQMLFVLAAFFMGYFYYV